MDTKIDIKPIGVVKSKNGIFSIKLAEQYISALTNIDGFSHLTIIWWGHLTNKTETTNSLVLNKPYKKGPEEIGIFATRSSENRPNPILITNIYVQSIDFRKGIIYTPYIDAEDGTPVLDIKPYHKSERIQECQVPDWCKHWPEWYEEAATFDWENEFNF
ncbi:MAG: TrmO family methyltransferase [Ignavibacteria bacterium]|jgi:tRNA (Thr-GGU) A37 N-methylase